MSEYSIDRSSIPQASFYFKLFFIYLNIGFGPEFYSFLNSKALPIVNLHLYIFLSTPISVQIWKDHTLPFLSISTKRRHTTSSLLSHISNDDVFIRLFFSHNSLFAATLSSSIDTSKSSLSYRQFHQYTSTFNQAPPQNFQLSVSPIQNATTASTCLWLHLLTHSNVFWGRCSFTTNSYCVYWL